MLTPREAFKVAFLRRCADAGLTMEETHNAVKQAQAYLTKPAFVQEMVTLPYRAGLDVAGNTGKSLSNIGLTAMLLGPAAAGLAGGYGLSRMTDIDDTDIKSIKKRELIDEYYRQIDLMRAKKRGIYKKPTGQK